MRQVLIRLTALCMAAALSEQLTAGSRLKDGLRLLYGLLAAGLILRAVGLLPEVLFEGLFS